MLSLRKYSPTKLAFASPMLLSEKPRRTGLYDRLVKEGQFTPHKFVLLQLLNPEESAKMLNEKLTSGGDAAAIKTLLAAAGSAGSPEAGKGLVNLLGNDKTPPELRVLALECRQAEIVKKDYKIKRSSVERGPIPAASIPVSHV